jgi:hypothetical protein
MNFFCTKKHCTDWIETAAPHQPDLFVLNLEEALAVARWLFDPGPATRAQTRTR